ncbi:MAG: DUF1579 domain-containing protein [Acidobacteriota bacterium]|nr:DUF1579 domain-containing protein [Acidobacteriota bacterium]
MSMLEDLLALAGKWSGTYRLIVDPADPVRVSPSTLLVAPIAGARFARFDYQWGYEGQPQDGSLLVGYEKERGVVTAVWVDSWHMASKAMVCEGSSGLGGGRVELRGTYAAPPGPDWGWRTVLDRGQGDTFRMVMYNVSPDGHEDLAVEAVYRRS